LHVSEANLTAVFHQNYTLLRYLQRIFSRLVQDSEGRSLQETYTNLLLILQQSFARIVCVCARVRAYIYIYIYIQGEEKVPGHLNNF